MLLQDFHNSNRNLDIGLKMKIRVPKTTLGLSEAALEGLTKSYCNQGMI